MSYNVYPWYNNSTDLPNHSYMLKKNQTLLWHGTDTSDLFYNNLQNVDKNKMLIESGFTDPITYSFNNCGFRADAFDNRPAGLAFGCSFTEGTGLRLEQTWPFLLANMADTHVWNLGISGAALDTVFRLLDYYLLKFNPKFVCVLTPPHNRFEYCDLNVCYPVIQPGASIHSSFDKEWLTQEINAIHNKRKNLLAIQQVCQENNIPVFFEDCEIGYDFDKIGINCARDLQHYGAKSHQYIASRFYQHVRQIQ